jgi:hypothetical protein
MNPPLKFVAIAFKFNDFGGIGFESFLLDCRQAVLREAA